MLSVNSLAVFALIYFSTLTRHILAIKLINQNADLEPNSRRLYVGNIDVDFFDEANADDLYELKSVAMLLSVDDTHYTAEIYRPRESMEAISDGAQNPIRYSFQAISLPTLHYSPIPRSPTIDDFPYMLDQWMSDDEKLTRYVEEEVFPSLHVTGDLVLEVTYHENHQRFRGRLEIPERSFSPKFNLNMVDYENASALLYDYNNLTPILEAVGVAFNEVQKAFVLTLVD